MDTTTSQGEHSGSSFRNLGIAPSILTMLDKLSYTTPTPIQREAIAPAIEGKDVVGIAQTGTGKTLAFGIPVIQRLLAQDGRALIVVPTRELAIQVDETFQKVGAPLGIRTAVLIGGHPMRPQVDALRRNPRVVVATPGRLLDHMEQKTVRLDTVCMLVLDEADRMLDMGFLPQIKRVLAEVPANRQSMLFSATLSAEILTIATKTMKLPLRIEVAPQGTTAERVTQELFIVRRDDKPRLLEKLLVDHRGSTLVFTRTKHGASRVASQVTAMGHTATEIHSNRSLNQRKAALAGFKTGRYRVLVATDIVARGIDVKGVELVVNFDLPEQSSDYVHRIGRTARAGAEGHAISFVLPEQRHDIRDIERLIKKQLSVTPLPALPDARPTPPRRPETTYSTSRSAAHAPRRTSSGGRPYRSSGPSSTSAPRHSFSSPRPAGSGARTSSHPSRSGGRPSHSGGRPGSSNRFSHPRSPGR